MDIARHLCLKFMNILALFHSHVDIFATWSHWNYLRLPPPLLFSSHDQSRRVFLYCVMNVLMCDQCLPLISPIDALCAPLKRI